MVAELEARLVARIERDGPMGFDELQANALYAPDLGFYTSGRGAGRRRDFLTSPEVGPLFGAVIARALDEWWDEAGNPPVWPVIECGAGPGTLARTVLAAAPRCRDALALVLVEVGQAQWSTHPERAVSRADLPAPGELDGRPAVVLANELLDNLPVQVVERTASGWQEVRVGAQGGRLVEVLGPLDAPQQRWCDERAPGAPIGARIPVQVEAATWLAEALELAGTGRVVALDYARTSAEMAAAGQDSWMRTYAGHGRGGRPLDDVGGQDITCDVAIDQLALVASPSSVASQADFLRDHSIDELVEEGRQRWAARGFAGGLEAIAARSRATEAEALLDPDGLGAFTVAEWA